MSTTTSFHGVATARAQALSSGTVNAALADNAGNTVNVFITTRAQADALIAAFTEARSLLPAAGEQAPPDAGDTGPGGVS